VEVGEGLVSDLEGSDGGDIGVGESLGRGGEESSLGVGEGENDTTEGDDLSKREGSREKGNEQSA